MRRRSWRLTPRNVMLGNALGISTGISGTPLQPQVRPVS